MMDKVNVIESLEELEGFLFREYEKAKDDIDTWYFRYHAVSDALVLLKEQEPVKPLAQADDTFECSCGAIVGWDELDASGIVKTHLNYCPFCGRAVKWER